MKRIEIEVLEETRDDGSRLRRVAEILAGGVYAFLEEKGYLKEAEEEKLAAGQTPLPNPLPQGERVGTVKLEENELKKAGEDGKVSPASDGRKEYPDKAF